MVVSTQLKTKFDHFVEYITEKYPTVNRLRVDNAAYYNVCVVEYRDKYSRNAEEIPPLFTWYIGDKWFSFVPKPIINTIKPTYFFGLFKGKQYQQIYYKDVYEQLFSIITNTVLDKSEQQINEELGWCIDRFGVYRKM